MKKILLVFLLFELLSQDSFCQSFARLFKEYGDRPDTTFVINKRRATVTLTKSERNISISILREWKRRSMLRERTLQCEWEIIDTFSRQYFSNTNIPELNRKILHAIDSLVGKKVGKGICRELIYEVLRNSEVEVPTRLKVKKEIDDFNAQWKTIYWKNIVAGSPTSNDTIYPGDIIEYANHVAIIYKVISPTEYIIVQQNFSGKLKYSHVGFEQISVPVYGYYFVSIFRPIPKTSL